MYFKHVCETDTQRLVPNKMIVKQALTHFPESWVSLSEHYQISWDDCLYVGDTFDVEGFEDDCDGLDNHHVVRGLVGVSDDSHQQMYRHCRVELFQGTARAHQLTYIHILEIR